MRAEENPAVGSRVLEANAAKPFANSKDTGDTDLTEISAGSSNPRYEVYLSGWAAGWDSREAEIQRLRWERDLWYFCANNRGKRPSDFYAATTNDLWAEAAA